MVFYYRVQGQQVKMSADVRQYAPLIKEYFDFASCDAHMFKHGIISLSEYESFHKASQSGSLTNCGLVSQLVPKISEKPRKFYRALREYVHDKGPDVHSNNKELFDQLPDNFVSTSVQS